MTSKLRRITHGRTLASVALAAGARAHAVAHAPCSETREHAHERASLSLVLAGSFRERRPYEARNCGPLDVLFKPPGLPHATATGAAAPRTLTLDLDPAALAPELARLDRAVQTTGGPVVAALLRLAASLPRGTECARADGDASAALDEALSGLVELVRSIQLPVRGEPCESFDLAHDRLAPGAELLATSATVRHAAVGARMHPVAFARAFRSRFGCAPTAYRRRRRVASAAGAIPGTRTGLAAVALDAGFADQAHMTRAFRTETGLTPGAYRALVADRFFRA